SVELPSQGASDYTKFSISQYQAAAGLKLNLPLDRLEERNTYRGTLITFERQIRSLAITLDGLRNNIRQDLRTLDQTRQNYQIQESATVLADSQVEGAELQLQA